MKTVISYLFLFASPIMCGAFLAFPLLAYLGDALGGTLFALYSIVWLGIWHDYYDQGRKLDL